MRDGSKDPSFFLSATVRLTAADARREMYDADMEALRSNPGVQHSVSGIEDIASTESVDFGEEKGNNRDTFITGGDNNDNRGVREGNSQTTDNIQFYGTGYTENVGNAQADKKWESLRKDQRTKITKAEDAHINASSNY